MESLIALLKDHILSNPSRISWAVYLLLVCIVFYLLLKIKDREERKKERDDARKRYLDDVRDIIKRNQKGSKKIFDAKRYVNDFTARRR